MSFDRIRFKPVALAAWLLLGVAFGVPAFPAEHAGHVMVNPRDLKWEDVPSLPPGAKIAVIEGPLSQPAPFIARIRLPANYRIPAHWHPTVERVTVLSGMIHVGMGDKLDTAKGTALGAGSVAILPARSNHYAWTTRETVLQLNGNGPWGITYVDPADDPRKK